jgi:hypothetical protein
MNRTDLFNEVKSWLEAAKLNFGADPEDSDFLLCMNLENALLQVRIICEEEPAAMQIICNLPLKVPSDKIPDTASFLHNVNVGLRIGTFQLLLEARIILFRLTVPVYPEADLAQQFGSAFSTALNTMDNYLPALALFLSSTKKARHGVAKFKPSVKSQPCEQKPVGPGPRFELN